MANFSKLYKSSFFLLRTSSFPVENLWKFSRINTIQKLKVDFIEDIKSNSFFMEALCIASEDISHEFNKYIAKTKDYKDFPDLLFYSLLKYYTRISSRPTPFGLFSGCTLGTFSIHTEIDMKSPISYQTKTYLDITYLLRNKENVEKESTSFKYYSNSTIYFIGEKLKYIEMKYDGSGDRFSGKFNLIEIECTSLLKEIILYAQAGRYKSELVNFMIEKSITINEASDFVNNLILNQLLVSEFSVNISGQEYLDRLIEILSKDSSSSVNLMKFIQIKTLLNEIDTIQIGKKAHYLNKLKEITNIDNSKMPISELVHIDLVKPANTANLDVRLTENILNAAEVLRNIFGFSSYLNNFKDRFIERYAQQEIPLTEALDPEYGIGYEGLEKSSHPIVDDFPFYQSASGLKTMDSGFQFILDKYIKAINNNQYEIQINDEEVGQIEKPPFSYPEGFYAVISLLGNNNDSNIYLNVIAGPNINVLGRFCRSDIELHSEVQKMIKEEENRNKISASIIHLPFNGRAGNVVIRPALRNYEISLGTISVLPDENKININDLMLSVKKDKLFLRCKKLNKEIAPRLDNAHNFSFSNLSIYNFLCDYQYQDQELAGRWRWGLLQESDFLPRVRYKNVILSLATWNIKSVELDPFKKLDNDALINKFSEFRLKKAIPEKVIFKEGDNFLLLDITTLNGISLLLKLAKNNMFMLQEAGYDFENMVVKSEEGTFLNEIIIPFTRKDSMVQETPQSLDTAIDQKRVFNPGSEWLFLKLYTGHKLSDEILINHINILVNELTNRGLILKWFFIRYSDPDFHIRIRFLISKQQDLIRVKSQITKCIELLSKKKLIWKSQYDTYVREIERYGAENIELSETFFYQNSQFVLKLLEIFTKEEYIKYFWITSVWGVDHILNSFYPLIQEKLTAIANFKEKYENEFSLSKNKSLRETIKKKYREHSLIIEHFIGNKKNYDIPIALKYILNETFANYEVINSDSLNMFKNQSTSDSYDNIVFSFIHMFVNRLVHSKARENELICYEYLYKFHSAKVAKLKYSHDI